MKIICSSFGEFMEVIESLAKRGLGFEAEVRSWTIKLNGSY